MEHKDITAFIHHHIKPEIREADYDSLPSLADILDTFTNMTYKAVYVIDYNKGNFSYVSDSPVFLCGKTRRSVLETGLRHFVRICAKEELAEIERINGSANIFWSKLPAEKKKEYSLTYNFHIGNNLVHHKMCPLMLDKNGNVWLALCTISLAYNTANFNASIIHEKSHLSWKYDSDTESWKENIRTALSDNEKKVLAMSYAGMTIGQISKQLCKSVETIKKYRQSIFLSHFP